jgi:hypothetical protein
MFIQFFFYYDIWSCPCFHSLIINFVIRKQLPWRKDIISVLQSSLCTEEIASTALSISSTEGAFIVSKNTSKVEGAPMPLIWLTDLHAHFLLLKYF